MMQNMSLSFSHAQMCIKDRRRLLQDSLLEYREGKKKVEKRGFEMELGRAVSESVALGAFWKSPQLWGGLALPISHWAGFHACLSSGHESGVLGLEQACQAPLPLAWQYIWSLCHPPWGDSELGHSWDLSVCRAMGRTEAVIKAGTNTRF